MAIAKIDWLAYYNEHGKDPEFDVYGSDIEETLRETYFTEAVWDKIAYSDFDPEHDETVTISAGNAVTDEQGRRINIDGDSPYVCSDNSEDTFSLKDVTEITVNVREWCRINNAMDLLEDA